MTRESKILVTCARRNNIVLAKELEALGFPVIRNERFSIAVKGTFEDTYRLNLYLRSANRVLFQIKGFKAHKPEILYQELIKIPWEKFLFSDGYVHISCSVKNDFINDTRFANLKTKDAIVDRMVNKTGERPNSGKDKSRACLFLFWHNDDCAIYIDTSGETIAKHGYRKHPYKAPLLEALAATIIYSTQWDQKSNFINPMCGSGTLAIEAALIALNKPPGLMRENFSFMHFKMFKPLVWKKIREDASGQTKDKLVPKILASDIDPRAVNFAKANAKIAGVDHLIDWNVCDFRDSTVPPGDGVVIFNPEYGERLGEEEHLAMVYKQMGDFMKTNCQGYMGYIFTGNLNLAKQVGLRTKRKIEFFNAKIDCRLLEYELYKGTKREH